MGFTVEELLSPQSREEVRARLADDVAFHSPFTDYAGADDVAHLLTTIGQTVEELRVEHEYRDGARWATEFRGAVGEHPVSGVLIQRAAQDGRLAEATLLLRPFASLRAAMAAMGEKLAAAPLPSQR